MSRVLIIDDSSFQRKMIKKSVEELGHETILADSGKEGLKIIRDEKPDFVFLDLLMPEMTGFDVLQSLKDAGNKTPVVVISADIQESTKEKCFGLGAAGFINKPPQKEAIQKVLGK